MQDWQSRLQESRRCRAGGWWCRTSSCWYVLLQEDGCRCRTGSCFCREVPAGAGVVVAAAVKWSPVQESSWWCRLKEY